MLYRARGCLVRHWGVWCSTTETFKKALYHCHELVYGGREATRPFPGDTCAGGFECSFSML